MSSKYLCANHLFFNQIAAQRKVHTNAPRCEKSAFRICENKGADQLRGHREADQRLCFRNTDNTIPLLPKFIRNFKPLANFCGCKARFVSDLVGNPEDRFSHDEAQIEKVNDCTDTEADVYAC